MPEDKKVDEKKPEDKKPEKREIPEAEKKSIIREAVSYYLRQDFRMPEIREVCEEFIAAADKEARGASGEHAAKPHNEHSQHEHTPPVTPPASEYNKPKK